MGHTINHEDVAQHVGNNVARFRAQRQLSLSRLATKAGVSKRTLTNVEQGNNVTLQTLLSIAEGLEVELATLLFDGYTGPNGQIQVVRAGEVEAVDVGARLVRQLCEGSSLPSMRLSHIVFRDGKLERGADAPRGVLYRVFVLSGEVTFGPAESPAILEPGDFATMRADVPHVLGAVNGNASALMLVTT